MTARPHENGHARRELRFECDYCHGFLLTRPLDRDRSIRSVVARIFPVAYFDERHGAIHSISGFLNSPRVTESESNGGKNSRLEKAWAQPRPGENPGSRRDEKEQDELVPWRVVLEPKAPVRIGADDGGDDVGDETASGRPMGYAVSNA